MDEYLATTYYLDWDAESVRSFGGRAAGGAEEARERAIRIFYAVRDGLRYDPYTVTMDPERYRASVISAQESSFCIPKAILLAAACRAVGVPARLGFADVRNHLASERLLALLGTDVFAFHGYAELWLEGRWVKATPAFNLELCQRFGVKALDFDGRADAMLQPFDLEGRRHMEYIRDRGIHADFPFEEMVRVMTEVYPNTTVDDLQRGNDEIFSGAS
jgi:transglutaminase-like putative cysteine protease